LRHALHAEGRELHLVPPTLLEMTDNYRHIKVRTPTAVALFAVNVSFLLTLPFL